MASPRRGRGNEAIVVHAKRNRDRLRWTTPWSRGGARGMFSAEMKVFFQIVVSAVVGAAGASVVLSVWEIARLVGDGAPLFEALAATLAAYALVTLASAMVGALTVWAIQRLVAVLGEPSRIVTGALFSAVIFGALLTWGMAAASTVVFASTSVQWIATSLATPPILLAALFVIWLASRRESRPLSAKWLVDLGLLLAAALAALLGLASPGVVEALRPLSLAPYAACLLAAILVANHHRAANTRTSLIAAAMCVPYFIGGVGWLVVEPAGETRLAIEQSSVVPKFVANLAPAGNQGSSTGARGTATCTPGTRLPATSDISPVGEAAPDIIFLTVDSLRWDHTSLSDYERPTTPQLKQRAKQGAIFSRAYSPASSTRQTFRALFTGVHPSLVTPPKSRRWALALPDGQETLASYLAAAGYHTAAVMTAKKTLTTGDNALHGFEVVDHAPRVWWEEHSYSAPLMIDRVIAHLSDVEDGRPKFAWGHLMEPHQKYHTGPDPIDFGKGSVARYDEAIHFVDQEVARLIDFVRSPARRDDTWLVIAADHGHAFGEHGERFHGHSVYEEEIHVPLLVFGPGVKGGLLLDQPVNLLDVIPTIYAMAEIGPFEALCGQNLLDALRGRNKLPARPVFVEQLADESDGSFHVAWIDGDMKLTLRPLTGLVELYDLSADPDEKSNLAETRPDDVKRLKSALMDYLTERGMDPSYYGLSGTKP